MSSSAGKYEQYWTQVIVHIFLQITSYSKVLKGVIRSFSWIRGEVQISFPFPSNCVSLPRPPSPQIHLSRNRLQSITTDDRLRDCSTMIGYSSLFHALRTSWYARKIRNWEELKMREERVLRRKPDKCIGSLYMSLRIRVYAVPCSACSALYCFDGNDRSTSHFTWQWSRWNGNDWKTVWAGQGWVCLGWVCRGIGWLLKALLVECPSILSDLLCIHLQKSAFPTERLG